MNGRMAYHVRKTDTPFRNRNAPAEEAIGLSAGACAMPAATSLTVHCQSARINSGAFEAGGLWTMLPVGVLGVSRKSTAGGNRYRA